MKLVKHRSLKCLGLDLDFVHRSKVFIRKRQHFGKVIHLFNQQIHTYYSLLYNTIYSKTNPTFRIPILGSSSGTWIVNYTNYKSKIMVHFKNTKLKCRISQLFSGSTVQKKIDQQIVHGTECQNTTGPRGDEKCED
jgi:hypothetical protein